MLRLAVAWLGGVWISGSAWSSPLDQWTVAGASLTTRDLFAVAGGGDRIVVVGAGGIIASSTNFSAWKMTERVSTLFGVAYGNGKFFAVGQNGAGFVSSDGQSWTPISSAVTSVHANDVAYANGAFTIVGNSGAVASTTGETFWSWFNSGTTEALRAVVHARGDFVAVGNQGVVLTSRDGFAWVDRTPLIFENMQGIAYGSGVFVAVGDFGGALTSQDGRHWTVLDAAIQDSLLAITYGGGSFVAVGRLGTLWTSSDGFQWTHRNSGTQADLFGIAYHKSRFVAVGNAGTILQSGILPLVTQAVEGSGVLESSSTQAPRLRFTREGSTETALTLNLAIAGTAINGVDYSAIGTTVVIPAGQSSTSITVAPIADDLPEGVETVEVTLLEAEAYGIEPPTIAVVSIADMMVTLETVDGQADESGLEPGLFRILRIGRADEALAIQYGIGGTATPGVDYEGLSGTATIPSDEHSVLIPITPRDDDESEGSETILITLRPGARYLMGVPKQGTVTLRDDESRPEIDWNVWQWRHPNPAGVSFDKAVFGNNRFAALTRSGGLFSPLTRSGRFFPRPSREGAVFTSLDGRDWITGNPGAGFFLYDLAWAHGRFVISAAGGITLTSTDGREWVPHRVQPSARNLIQLYSANELLLGFDDYGNVVTSLDGVLWTEGPASMASYLSGLAFGNSRYVAVGQNGGGAGSIWTSADGGQWSAVTNFLERQLYSVAFGNGMFLATASSGLVLTSVDGQAWTAVHDAPDLPLLTALTYGAGRFAASAYNEVWTTTDGAAWVEGSFEESVWLTSLSYGNDTFLAVGGGTINAHVITSTDGMSWTPQHHGTLAGLRGIAFDGQTLVAAGDQVILSSSNGVDWVERVNDPSIYLRGLTYGNNLFVAVGSQILTSVDGIQWSQYLVEGPSLSSVIWGQDRFVAVGDNGAVMTSPDGMNWTAQEPLSSGSLSGLTWGNGLYVAVTASWPAEVFTSSDGEQWHAQSQISQTPLHEVTYARGTFLAGGGSTGSICCGDDPTIFASADGSNWVPRASSGIIHGITTSTDGTFVAVGGGSERWGHGEVIMYRNLVTSPDSVHWTPHSPSTPSWLNKVIWAYGKFFAVGENGAIMESRTLPSTPKPRFATGGITLLPEGGIRLLLEAPEQSSVILESSANLQSWSFVDSAECLTGTVQFDDLEGTQAGIRFYRARAATP